MNHQPWLTLLKKYRAIAVIRSSEKELARQMAKAAASGGIQFIEITWNTHQAAELIAELRSELPTFSIGTGTLLNLEQLGQAIDCGAQFLFAPHTDVTMIERAIDAQVPIVPGAFTPTEIMTAWQAGATCVKVFPISGLGGAAYLKSLQGPLGHIPLIPTGGVTVENAKLFIDVGAIAVGLAGDLFPKHLVENQDWEAVSQIARTLAQKLTTC
ncbi:MAG: bifunctional 4-hydroxy-2-oxoglutarate aldolase/2-dehydro-3-deoxy-phosphogluconate aldolase [Oscillatoriales cyanobacterium RU_3_3]|nr:bifunctional 4-hydroxy-2-oxoglutarate aldolase/2-dehydro-3-deoxy-phosphogluconate aldolase [Microcoleus sp. SU_5_6]NJL65999.1 bifunctional 4-hydroxy-2-oxoglutarate aldolase/2-dehydro-3-deoxy-phosphogluconate aldolase [Microcoleus sp. SM1_3_4]NJM62940.1 bifunctional 4-hydroxy-2-oxoglutarate aldolase/2-dehydro-3-deoxy-phosphogluconate aldolase [Oscillatoriales cyanobacterium RU_3_3]NJR23782.1 bifunctional 4-hydroxy-2-oxoglutarate aldolase/2-dehydro-3-deoxy-phosphogluconate aldolase [Richelia sp